MLTRIAASAAALILATTAAIAFAPGTALADCHVVGGIVMCAAHDASRRHGSHGGGGPAKNKGVGNGCQNQGNGVPLAVCTANVPAAPRVASIDLAWNARGLIQPPAPQIHWSPEPRTYVRLRTGLWVDPADFQPLQSDPPVVAGGQTVIAYATPKRAEWNLVETTIVCRDGGTPHGTSCGYTYQHSSANQTDGKYQISATIVWGVTWTCTGNCDQAGGTLADLRMTSTTQLPVDEIQTESQPG
jgi:hypothetical protein